MMNRKLGMLLLSAAAGIFANQIVRADVVAQWHLDEAPGSPMAADSVGAANGTLFGSAAFESGGIVGNCVRVTTAGNGYVAMGDNFRFTTGDFAIVAWARTAANDTTGDYFIVCKHRANITAGYMLGINANGPHGETDKAWFFASSSPTTSPVSTSDVNDGDWHQIVGVYRQGRQARIYVDGAPFEDSIGATNMSGNNAQLALAAIDFSGQLQGLFTGWIDEVQLYNHLLTERQIQFLFENPAETVIGGLGDMNCDGVVSVSDIGGFVLALTNPAGYAAQFPSCDLEHADINMDGNVSVSDIGEFVQVLTEG